KGRTKLGKQPLQRRWRPVLHPLQYQLWKHDLIDLRLSDDLLMPEDTGWPHITYRIDTNYWGEPYQSPASGVVLPDERDFAQEKRLNWVLDDYHTGTGGRVRRVRFRSRITLQDSPPGNNGNHNWWRMQFRPQPAAIIIQCAANARELDMVLEDLNEDRKQEVATLKAETNSALAQHRRWLLLICTSTFVATVLGSFVLVWLGLSPLSRLSDAVSKVSPRNFSLDINSRQLPQELRPIAERLSTTLEMLHRAFAREKQATADISHELRTPLAALLTNIDLGLRKTRTPEGYRELFEGCKCSAQQMHQIIERLLTLARLDAGVDRLRAMPVDLAELAAQCAAVVRPLAEARGLELAVYDRRPLPVSFSEDSDLGSPADVPGSVRTDPDKLREILTNLLHNAVQYNRPEGRIDLTVDGDSDRVVLEVSDTGIGISAEARENIFERFYRADPSRNADDLHAGLGLAIVREYVGLMGGRITVDSKVGEGSTFRVELPVQPPV
ncbi:MAG: sensor histidine kinase, partial [Thermomicrobiales bacterium]